MGMFWTIVIEAIPVGPTVGKEGGKKGDLC